MQHWAGCTNLNVKGLLLKICTVLRTLVVLRVDPAGRLPTSAQRSARMRGVKNTCHLHAAWAVQPWSLDGCRLVCRCWPRFYRRAMMNARSQMIVRTRIVLARCHQWAGKDHWMVLRLLQSSQPAPSRSTLPVPQRRIQSAIKVAPLKVTV